MSSTQQAPDFKGTMQTLEKSHFRLNVAPSPDEVRPPDVLRKALQRLLGLWEQRKEERRKKVEDAEKSRKSGKGGGDTTWKVLGTAWRKPRGGCLLSAEESAAAAAEAAAARGKDGEIFDCDA